MPDTGTMRRNFSKNILEDIHIEDRMCEEFHGTFRQGIELNNLRMSEQIPSIQEQIDKEYQPFSIIANLILSYCRTGNINNPTGYQGGLSGYHFRLYRSSGYGNGIGKRH